MKHSRVFLAAKANLPTKFGLFKICVYKVYKTDSRASLEHVALIRKDIYSKRPILTRIHSRCLTGDIFGSRRCDCSEQLLLSLQKIAQQGSGVLIYLDQEGRGIGLENKIRAYALQDQGLDTVSANQYLGFAADQRDYRVAAEILRDLGVSQINLLTNNPGKIKAIRKSGINVKERIPLEVKPNKYNYTYLLTKKHRLNHFLCLQE